MNLYEFALISYDDCTDKIVIADDRVTAIEIFSKWIDSYYGVFGKLRIVESEKEIRVFIGDNMYTSAVFVIIELGQVENNTLY